MNCCTDPKLLDVAGALDSLPALPLAAVPQREAIALSATGTDDSSASPLVPTSGKPCILESIADMITANGEKGKQADAVAVSAYPVNRKDPLTSAVNGSTLVEPTGIEPATYWLQTNRSPK